VKALASLISLGRLVFGTAFIAKPGLMERAWIGKQARLPGARLLARAVGARDLALGLGGLYAVGRIPSEARNGVLAIGSVFSVLSVIAAAALGPGDDGRGG
jgi:hypothetical protein